MTDRRSGWLTNVLVVLGMSAAMSAQDPHSHQANGHDPAVVDPHRRVEAFLREADEVIASGRGFGMAFAADQNGYPGPMHAAELREALQLSDTQVTRLEALTEAMFAASRPLSQELLDAEAQLHRLFAGEEATATSVEELVRRIERLRADVRLVHLRAHLDTYGVLTAEQRQRYGQIRWGDQPAWSLGGERSLDRYFHD